MKKTYVTPSIEVIKVNATAILAASIGVHQPEVNPDVEQQGRDENVSNPNIWDQQW